MFHFGGKNKRMLPGDGLCVREERSTDIRPCKSPIRNMGHTQRSELSTGDSLGKREGVSAEEVDMSMSKRRDAGEVEMEAAGDIVFVDYIGKAAVP